MLQIAGRVPLTPWSLRPFSAIDAAHLRPSTVDHPWAARAIAPDTARVQAHVIGPQILATYNSAFPFSINDGAVWEGRGATVAASAGAVARWHAVTLQIEPIAFVAQNAAFTLMPNGLSGPGRFGDPLEPQYVDVPQRFGDARYARLDPGQSTLRVDLFGLAAGVSSANEIWGPAQIDPLLLGVNAAGIPRAFVGTSRPTSWGLGTVHVRVEAGTLSQTAYATTSPDSSRRQMAGVVGVATIRGVPGLELGAARFYHRPLTEHPVMGALRTLFQPVLKDQLGATDLRSADNQLASVFARWAVPAAGVEAYGEFGRNDHSQDVRDLAVEPDQNSAYMFGLQRVWAGQRHRLVALRLESMNSRITHLARVRGQTRWVQHSQMRQGHTQRGELLGSAAGLGGSATTLGADLYRVDGRWTFELARRVRQQPTYESVPTDAIDVYTLARVERLWFSRVGDLSMGITAIRELNRDFRGDAFGLHLEAAWRMR